MRLPEFEYLAPKNLDEALDILDAHGPDCLVLAGGTDILVRMKNRLATPEYLLSLKSADMLSYIRQKEERLEIGAGTTLSEIKESEKTRPFAALLQAVSSVGAVSIQHSRGTVGGNLCQDARCLYYNQSDFWRSAKQKCHKAGGRICYARDESDRCNATFQSDMAPALIASGARVVIIKKGGRRFISLADLYSSRGEAPISLEPEEILSEVRLPVRGKGFGSAYKKLSYRSAIDYPVASAGVSVMVENGSVKGAEIVIGAISRAPLRLLQAAGMLCGKSAGDRAAIRDAAEKSMDLASAFAVDNVGASLEYRIKMIPILVKRAIDAAILNARQ